ncbi:MAG: cell division protein FtsZ [Paludibacteraceae bacterium]|nr:cell division protein FtsZ [Paludibacteraceae bacterium]
MDLNEPLPLENIEIQEDCLIKVMGVGGGGCKAVSHMYEQNHIAGVSFLVCNTDQQALTSSPIPAKLQLGKGLGAGGRPETARQYAEESRDAIKQALNDGTKMLFIAAGMGGGTGTGASPIIAQVAQEMGILTVGIVTIPFAHEGIPKIRKAFAGVAALADSVDAILIINNEKLKIIYPDLNVITGFKKSDEVVTNAARSIAEIITIEGYINTDFADVYNTLKDGHVAIMNVGEASGEHRFSEAINNALHSPLINTNNIHGAKRILMQFYCSEEQALNMKDTDDILKFVNEVGDEVEVQWGITLNNSLGDTLRVTLIATGYEVSDIPSLHETEGKPSIEEAINAHYNDLQQTNKEDEIPQQIDLKVEQGPVTTPKKEEQAVATANDDIIISIGDDNNDTKKNNTADQRRFGWMRQRR